MDNKSAEEPQWHPPGVAALPCRIRHRGRRCPRGWLGLPRVLQVPCRRVPVTPGSSCQVHAVPSNLEMHQEPAADAKGSPDCKAHFIPVFRMCQMLQDALAEGIGTHSKKE